MKEEKRDICLDLTRIIAYISVICVHFFLNSNFYYVRVIGKPMFAMMIARNAFMVCVPLFLLLTGYLMSNKEIDITKDYIKYVCKLKYILLVYVLSTCVILIFDILYLKDNISLKDALFNILGFKQYSWYINMYIGLYLLIPFLNKILINMERKEKLIVTLVLVFLTVSPTIFNIYDFSLNDIFTEIQSSREYNKVVPDFWVNIYPITYYFIGAYLREINLKKCNSLKVLLCLIVTVLVFGIYNIWRSYDVNFVYGAWCDWGSLQNTVNSVLVFILINSISMTGNRTVTRIMSYISKLTLGAYLLSYIPDKVIYPKLIETYSMVERGGKFIVVVGGVLIISLMLSACVNGLIDVINIGVKNITK